jgi:hypothetical protein
MKQHEIKQKIKEIVEEQLQLVEEMSQRDLEKKIDMFNRTMDVEDEQYRIDVEEVNGSLKLTFSGVPPLWKARVNIIGQIFTNFLGLPAPEEKVIKPANPYPNAVVWIGNPSKEDKFQWDRSINLNDKPMYTNIKVNGTNIEVYSVNSRFYFSQLSDAEEYANNNGGRVRKSVRSIVMLKEDQRYWPNDELAPVGWLADPWKGSGGNEGTTYTLLDLILNKKTRGNVIDSWEKVSGKVKKISDSYYSQPWV